ncbi:hypothetical protein GWI33_018940 [Rhynchophorus ferrugineus]|uniref:Uncharacterized protein n=1 Tax=Rhynchophorus ferrugineus TaxID=354439 RepID=A0A834HUT0_RHYFE|nr:hypothetical protein GWI33_018940 [Rhynchophorus ferrugineus]
MKKRSTPETESFLEIILPTFRRRGTVGEKKTEITRATCEVPIVIEHFHNGPTLCRRTKAVKVIFTGLKTFMRRLQSQKTLLYLAPSPRALPTS